MQFESRLAALVFATLFAAHSAFAQRTTRARSAHVDVTFVTDEPDAALAVLRDESRHEIPPAVAWTALFGSAGYAHLKERESSMGRAFTDSSFATFLRSDSLIARSPALSAALSTLEKADVSTAARTALAYLPQGTDLRARLYLEIKPFPNSFVFTGRDSIPSIFLYVSTSETRDQLENTLAHELHHIGTNAACRDSPPPDSTRTTPAVRMLLEYLTAFAEGRAMLAAAGSPTVNAHAEDADSIQQRWNRDVAHAPEDMRDLAQFFGDVLAGRITSADSVRRRGNTYFGVQGPWYTVGWLMASTVERELGRAALVRTTCAPVDFLAEYNRAAERSSRRNGLPRWPAGLIDTLAALAHPPGRSP